MAKVLYNHTRFYELLSWGRSRRPVAVYFGRWQPVHRGHEALIRMKLNAGIPVLICVRDVLPDEKNPYTTDETILMLAAAFADEHNVAIIPVPDIESVNWGRGVGYQTNEFVLPDDIECISATEVRRRIHDGDNSWRDLVNPRVAQQLEIIHGLKG